jgi:cholesterol transport system auxiliary component
MTSELPQRRTMIVAAWAVLAAGCSVLPSPPASQIYRLSPLTGDLQHRRTLLKRLVVDTPTASESLDTNRIALTRGPTRFDYFANSLWTDRVPMLVQTLLVETLESYGGIAEVGRDVQAAIPEQLLKTEIRKFEADYAGATDQAPTVVVSVDLDLVRMPDHRMLGHTLLTNTAVASRNSVDSVVLAFDVVVGRILVDCVDWTRSVIMRSA